MSMIISIGIENFLSIKEKIVLNLEATSSKKLINNTFEYDNEKFLKSIVIYGANASGKTNFIKAIDFMKSMVINSHRYNINEKILVTPFKLDNKYEEKPTRLEISFIYKDVKYDYSFSLSKEKIVDEALYYYPNNRKSMIFERKNTNDYEFNTDKYRQNLFKDQTINNTLYLSRATQLGFDKTKPVYEFFMQGLVTSFNPQWEDYTVQEIYKNEKLRNNIINFLKRTDFTIEDILVEKKKGKSMMFEFGTKENQLFAGHREVEKEILNVKFAHKNNNGDLIYFNLENESDGTKHLFGMLGLILNIIKNNNILVFDEIEKSLHPELTKFLVELFNNTNNKSQFIFTTHDTNLLDNELMRKDQIYFTQRNKQYATELYSLYDFSDFRDTLDFEKAYLDGKFGAVPQIDRRIIEIIKQWSEEE